MENIKLSTVINFLTIVLIQAGLSLKDAKLKALGVIAQLNNIKLCQSDEVLRIYDKELECFIIEAATKEMQAENFADMFDRWYEMKVIHKEIEN